MSSVYLDHAAATPVSERVALAMEPYVSIDYYNPSATYMTARAVRTSISGARSRVASVLGVRPVEIVFTAGGTEANNLALLGILREFPGTHVVTTSLEHDSVREPLYALSSEGWAYTEVNPREDGIMDVDAVIAAITDQTVLVSVMYANNEIGTVQPLKTLTQAVQSVRDNRKASGNTLPLYVHTDACQAGNYLDLHCHRLGVDLMTLNGGKLYGPKQTGVLYVSSNVKLRPIIYGGGQERGLRSGTENVAGIMGFAAALEDAQSVRQAEIDRLRELQKYFIEKLQEDIPQIIINGSLKHRLPNNVHITIPNTDNERVIFALDDHGVYASAGSACSASKDEPSHVLSSIGLSEELIRASLRFTMGRSTSMQDIDKTVSLLSQIVA